MAHLPYIQKCPKRKSDFSELPVALASVAVIMLLVYLFANYLLSLTTRVSYSANLDAVLTREIGQEVPREVDIDWR